MIDLPEENEKIGRLGRLFKISIDNNVD